MRKWLIGGGLALCTLGGGGFYAVNHYYGPAGSPVAVTSGNPNGGTTVIVAPHGPSLLSGKRRLRDGKRQTWKPNIKTLVLNKRKAAS